MLASATAMRNAALCLALVNNAASGQALITPLVAFRLLMVPPNALFAIYHAVQARRAASRVKRADAGG